MVIYLNYVRKVPGFSLNCGMSFHVEVLQVCSQSFGYTCVQSLACCDVQMMVMNIKMQILMHVLVLFPCYMYLLYLQAGMATLNESA